MSDPKCLTCKKRIRSGQKAIGVGVARTDKHQTTHVATISPTEFVHFDCLSMQMPQPLRSGGGQGDVAVGRDRAEAALARVTADNMINRLMGVDYTGRGRGKPEVMRDVLAEIRSAAAIEHEVMQRCECGTEDAIACDSEGTPVGPLCAGDLRREVTR